MAHRMRKLLHSLYSYKFLAYKYGLYLVSVGLIVFLLPRGGTFKYEFQKGKPWQYENLYAPMDFSLKKTQEEIAAEERLLRDTQTVYYTYNTARVDSVKNAVQQQLKQRPAWSAYTPQQRQRLWQTALRIMDSVYRLGVFQQRPTAKAVVVVKRNEAIAVEPNRWVDVAKAKAQLSELLASQSLPEGAAVEALVQQNLRPNVVYNAELTEKALQDKRSKISYTRGQVSQGTLIIARGEVVEAENFTMLYSLQEVYESEVWRKNNYYIMLLGYTFLVALGLLLVLLFLKKYRNAIFKHNTKVTFIFCNMLLMLLATTFVVEHNEHYVYAVPLCILPLVLKNFFDARLGLFVHIVTVLMLGFVVPNSFEYSFLQISAGMVSTLTVAELYKRANLFIAVGQVTLVYVLSYVAFQAIYEGSLNSITWLAVGVFGLNGLLTLFTQPLIYMFEKVFGLVSDVSLLELSNTNSKLLRELSDKAPGTFQHSLQVANLAEAAANAIGASAMLVRVGALYHDIGKLQRPAFFTENQTTGINPHDDLAPRESARIIVAHVLEGIEMARKHNLPDRIIDFIRTHHGTTTVYYFFKKQQQLEPKVAKKDFRYPGPTPFSKETAILMMADAVEAASKSLRNPTALMMGTFVEKIVTGQMQARQFANANITFKEIEQVKKVLQHKLISMYHLRVEYPE